MHYSGRKICNKEFSFLNRPISRLCFNPLLDFTNDHDIERRVRVFFYGRQCALYAKRLLDFGHVTLVSSHAMYFRTPGIATWLCQYTKNFPRSFVDLKSTCVEVE